jgi:hypothetical protein
MAVDLSSRPRNRIGFASRSSARRGLTTPSRCVPVASFLEGRRASLKRSGPPTVQSGRGGSLQYVRKWCSVPSPPGTCPLPDFFAVRSFPIPGCSCRKTLAFSCSTCKISKSRQERTSSLIGRQRRGNLAGHFRFTTTQRRGRAWATAKKKPVAADCHKCGATGYRVWNRSRNPPQPADRELTERVHWRIGHKGLVACQGRMSRNPRGPRAPLTGSVEYRLAHLLCLIVLMQLFATVVILPSRSSTVKQIVVNSPSFPLSSCGS